MGIMDIFSRGISGAPSPVPAANQQPASTGAPAAQQQQTPPSSTDNVTQADLANKPPGTPGATNKPVETSPLDTFKGLFDNVATPGANGVQPLNADPAKIAGVAKTLNFANTVQPETLRKALAGDAAALMEAMNEVGRNAFIASTQASSHLVDRQTSATYDAMQKSIPTHLRNFQSQEVLVGENPALNHPAVQPILKVIQGQIAQKYPEATSAELAAHAKMYFTGMLSAISKPPEDTSNSGFDPKDTSVAAVLDRNAKASESMQWLDWAGISKQ